MTDESTAKKTAPKSVEQTRRLYSNDKIKNLTKLKLQEYISSFFGKAHDNYGLLGAVSPRFINYNIDNSFDPKVDPTQRKLQIARYFDKLRAILPAILIVDGGVQAINHNIGLIGDAYTDAGSWHGIFPIYRKIPISIVIAARDVDEADEMSGVVSLMFNELRNVAGGSYITGKPEEGETWVITLPNAAVDIGALQNSEIPEDPVDRIWYSEATIEVFFEDKLQIKTKMPDFAGPGFKVSVGDLKGKTFKPEITVPDVIPLNSQTSVYISNFQDSYRVILSDSKIATLSYNMVLTPRRFGKFKIMVYDDTVGDASKRIIASKEVTVA